MENKYYVYIHIRLDTGEVFYVGKGSNGRAFSIHSRNRYWGFITNKTGWIASIVQDGMSEINANLLEMWLIAKFRHNGVKLANMTDGGDGFRAPNPSLRKPVVCSNGMFFDSVNDAASWANIDASKVTAAASGNRHSAGGYAWWYNGCEPKEYVDPKTRMKGAGSKGVYRSDGVYFKSTKEAAESVGVSPSSISTCLRGRTSRAGGFAWRRDNVPEPPRSMSDIYTEKNGVKVICIETGERFPSCSLAAKHMVTLGHDKADGWPISNCAKGKQKQAYGYTWSYA